MKKLINHLTGKKNKKRKKNTTDRLDVTIILHTPTMTIGVVLVVQY